MSDFGGKFAIFAGKNDKINVFNRVAVIRRKKLGFFDLELGGKREGFWSVCVCVFG